MWCDDLCSYLTGIRGIQCAHVRYRRPNVHRCRQKSHVLFVDVFCDKECIERALNMKGSRNTLHDSVARVMVGRSLKHIACSVLLF